MVEPVFQVLGAPTRVESSEEGERGGKVAADMNRRRRGREIRLAKLGRHVLKVRIPVRAAKEPCVSETGRISGVLAARGGGMPRQGGNGDNERQRFGLPVHPSIPFRILVPSRDNRHHGSNEQMFGPE